MILGKTTLSELAILRRSPRPRAGASTRNPWNPQRSAGRLQRRQRARRSPPGSSAPPRRPTAAARSGSRLPSAASFGLKPQRGPGADRAARPLERALGRAAASPARSPTPRSASTSSTAGRRRPGGPPAARASVRRGGGDGARTSCGSRSPSKPARAILPPIVSDEVRGGARRDRGAAALARPRRPPPRARASGWPATTSSPRYLGGIHDEIGDGPAPGAARGAHARLRPARPRLPGGARGPGDPRRGRRRGEDQPQLGAASTCSSRRPSASRRSRSVAGRARARCGPLLGISRVFCFTPIWNHTGQPAAAIPAGFSPSGLPRSVTLVGRPSDEPTLLSLAAQVEAERRWADRRPPLA